MHRPAPPPFMMFGKIKRLLLDFCASFLEVFLSLIGAVSLVLLFLVRPWADQPLAGLLAQSRSRLLVYMTNFLAGLCLALVPIVGPWPGPGGIPLTLLGLHLFSINYAWARKMETYIIEKGLGLGDLIFPDVRKYQLLWDLGIYAGLGLGVYAFITFEIGSWLEIILITFLGLLITCWLRNRHRWRRFSRCLKAKRRRAGKSQ